MTARFRLRLSSAVIGILVMVGATCFGNEKEVVLTGTVELVFANGSSILFRPGTSEELRELKLTKTCRITDQNGKVLDAESLKRGMRVTISYNIKTRVTADMELNTDGHRTGSPPSLRTPTRNDQESFHERFVTGVVDKVRNWQTTDHASIAAKQVGLINGHVLLQKKTGEFVAIPAENLSKADREFVGEAAIRSSILGRTKPSLHWKISVQMSDRTSVEGFANPNPRAHKTDISMLVLRDGLYAPIDIRIDRVLSIDVLEPIAMVLKYDSRSRTFKPLVTRDVAARWTPPDAYAGRGTNASSPSGSGKSRKALIAKILGATFLNWYGKAIGPAEHPGISTAARFGRNAIIESALHDVFPDTNDGDIQMIARVIALMLDDKLTFKNFAEETVKDSLKQALYEQDPRLGGAASVLDFLYEVHQARRQS